MARILVAYGTGEGQTAKVADAIVDHLAARGHDATAERIVRADAAPDPGNYDATVVAASIHVGKHQPGVVAYAGMHRDALDSRPSAFAQVCLSAASDDPARQAEAERYVEAFTGATGWDPDLVGVFAGALRYSEYGFLKRVLMKRVAADATGDTDASRDYEYTDWDDVARFADEVADLLEAEPTGDDGEADAEVVA